MANIVWTTTSTFNHQLSTVHNYGVLYGINYYSSNPVVIWSPTARDSATWSRSSGTTRELSLYAKVAYGQKPFATTPAAGWTRPSSF